MNPVLQSFSLQHSSCSIQSVFSTQCAPIIQRQALIMLNSISVQYTMCSNHPKSSTHHARFISVQYTMCSNHPISSTHHAQFISVQYTMCSNHPTSSTHHARFNQCSVHNVLQSSNIKHSSCSIQSVFSTQCAPIIQREALIVLNSISVQYVTPSRVYRLRTSGPSTQFAASPERPHDVQLQSNATATNCSSLQSYRSEGAPAGTSTGFSCSLSR
jgi:hypothetical protein